MEYELDDHTPRTCPDARLSQRIGGAKLCAAPATGQRRPDRRKGISHPSRTGNGAPFLAERAGPRSEEHTSELQSLLRISYAVCGLNKKRIPHASHYSFIAEDANQIGKSPGDAKIH